MPANDDETYGVGFGKPPKHRRFRKGVSGNPRGRPKGRRNLATVLEQTLQEKITITENGVRKSVTKLEAAVKRMVNKAASGDLLALRQLITIAASAGLEAGDAREKDNLSEVDLKVMNGVLKRLEQSKKGQNNDHGN
jgi:hypothetical protein